MLPDRNSIPASIIVLLFVWVGVQTFFYFQSGVKLAVDSAMYIGDAETLLSGTFPADNRSSWYIGYSCFIALTLLAGGSLTAVVWLQMAFSAIAAFCLYAYVKQRSGSFFTAFTATALYLVWVKIHEWNVFIYTESLFTSFCIISFVLFSFSNKLRHYLLLLPLAIFTFLIRPTGFGFIISLVVMLLHSYKGNKLYSGKYFLAAALLLLPVLLLANQMLKDYTLIESYTKAEIIYPNISLGLTAPPDLYLPATDRPALVRLLLFIVLNPFYFLKISILKLLLFFGNVKPYFSPLHNVFIVLVLYPIYYFAYRGINSFPGKPEERAFLVTFILIQGGIVALTTENWDGRFLVPVLPFVFILAAPPLQQTIAKLRLRRNKN